MKIVRADREDTHYQASLMEMAEAFSVDPFGANRPLSEPARAGLIDGLRAHPTTLVFLAFEDEVPIGMAICFRGFSTFAARPVVNIHDFFVSKNVRGRGVSRALLDAVSAYPPPCNSASRFARAGSGMQGAIGRCEELHIQPALFLRLRVQRAANGCSMNPKSRGVTP
jgi:GNAT superfamily N-acetyltransferase